MKSIDCRNLACPAPVINVKKNLETESELKVLLDDGAPRENVSRFAANRGFLVSEEQTGDGWLLTITAGDAVAGKQEPKSPADRIMLITSDRLGDGPEELGLLLMKNFIHTLLETRELPARIMFMNSGVRLTTEGSVLIEGLKKLEGMGVELLSCGLCLDYFGLKDKLLAGKTTNMLTTAESLISAGHVITL